MNRIISSIGRIKIVQDIFYRLFRANFWRNGKIKRYFTTEEEPKLQIGFGNNSLAGWLNTGISYMESKHGAYMDAGQPFPLPDASFNYVYSEHLFEHLTYPQARNMLKESYRVLKPGGVIRIATPNLRFLLGLYQDPEKPLHKEYIAYTAKNGGLPSTAVYVINRFHTAWGHQIIYDKETLSQALQQAGFKDICSCEVGESTHNALIGVEGHFKSLPFEYNRLETMILEATK